VKSPPVKILVVCMANVCRSPMAAAVIRGMAASQRGLALEIDSAGTRVARPALQPDPRADAALRRRGYTAAKGRSRALTAEDFDRYDLLLAMDSRNLQDMLAVAPAHHHAKAKLLLDFADGVATREVPDPYFGDAQGFERVLDLCEAGGRGVLRALSGAASPAAGAALRRTAAD
jgi:protein-tyrosine phosphatase